MIDHVWVVIIVQLVISLYLAWKISKLSDEYEMMQVIVGAILMGLDKESE